MLLGRALRETLNHEVSTRERAWLDRIESLRNELNDSTAEITVVDYGAVDPHASLSEESMQSGQNFVREIGSISKTASKPYFWSLLLFKLIRNFKPACCLELGTCLGISASFQAAALHLNGAGKIVTLEGSPSLGSLAAENFAKLGLGNVDVVVGRFQDTLKDVLRDYRPIDYAFIDGHHAEKATLAYFEEIAPFLADKALLVFDDITWSRGMRRAWETIAADARVKVALDLRQVGICIVDSGADYKKSASIPLM